MSYAYQERQRTRAVNGRYQEMNKCEFCGRPLGADYASLPDCNKTGLGLVLCPNGRCRKGMTDQQVEKALRS